MRKRIEVEADVDTCKFCGVEHIVTIYTERSDFDRRDRGWGLDVLDLWSSHPHNDASICRQCYDALVFCVPKFVRRPADCHRARMYELETCEHCGGEGCRECIAAWGQRLCEPYGDVTALPERPVENWSEVAYCGLVLAADGEHALLCTTRDEYWRPASPLEQSRDERMVVLFEDSPVTPFRTVRELRHDCVVARADLAERYPAWAVERCRSEAVQVALRNPVEILQ